MSTRLKVLLAMIALGGVLTALPFLLRTNELAPVLPPRAKLAVLIVVDQLRADYMTRWHDQFGSGGFRRLAGGTWFQNCHYPYALVETGTGRATPPSPPGACRPNTASC